MKLTLIRHGITEGNKRVLVYGSTDLPLLPEGREELQALKTEFEYPLGENYYSSGLIRTEETLQLLYGDIPHQIVPGLQEFHYGDWEMKTFTELSEYPLFQAWSKMDDRTLRCPGGGESLDDVYRRVRSSIAAILDSDEDSVCVIHGMIISLLLSFWFPPENENPFTYTPKPGYGYQVTFEKGKPVRYCRIPFEK